MLLLGIIPQADVGLGYKSNTVRVEDWVEDSKATGAFSVRVKIK